MVPCIPGLVSSHPFRGAAAATRWSRDGNVTLFMCAAPFSPASLSSRRVIQARDSLDAALSVRRRFLGRAAARAMFILARVCHGIACWSVGWLLRRCCDSCAQRSGYVVPPFPPRRCRPLLSTPFVAPARTLVFFHLRIVYYTAWTRVSYVTATRIQSSFTFQLEKANITFSYN